MSRIPNYYRPMAGNPSILGPLRWQDDVTGELPTAMMAFFKYNSLTYDHLALVREYGEYYINAPCWDWNPNLTEEGKQELAHLRSLIKEVKTKREIMGWVHQCLDIGIDPF
jgi:hypothetical protein